MEISSRKKMKLNRVAMFDTGGSTWINHPPIPAAGPKTCDHVHHQLGRELGRDEERHITCRSGTVKNVTLTLVKKRKCKVPT